jgi:hypothetical protein
MEVYAFSAHVHSDEFTWISVHCFGMYNFDSFNSSVTLLLRMGCYPEVPEIGMLHKHRL